MEISVPFEPTIYEQQLISIIRRLPTDQISQVVAFAKFLELQFREVPNFPYQNETEKNIAEENKQWDRLFARDDSQRLLEKMADEALAEINEGKVKKIIFTEDGQIKPE
ncbi:MAG: hypothetical protein HQK63_04390 [Desulfamplus sp.]|nr:hypothetical protein [Desulfamplus sp.]